MFRRIQLEDELLGIIRACLPEGVQCGFLPQGLDSASALVMKKGAVWLVYAGATTDKPQSLTMHVQRQTWTWSVLILAKHYRSPKNAGDAALDLLETVENALMGKETSAGLIYKIRDRFLKLPDDVAGIVGYEMVFAVQPYLRK